VVISHLTHEPGAQLKVRRLALDLVPYDHHGIYVDDDEVIEFGGGNIRNKGAVKVRVTTLSEFENGGNAEVVQHPVTWSGITYSHYLPPEETITRARWLLDHQPPSYWVAHRNCEYVANWCATGDFESFQTKKMIGLKVYSFLPMIVAMKKLPRRGQLILGGTSIIVTLVSAVPYLMDDTLPKHLRTYPNWRTHGDKSSLPIA
jgi:hypothetical protein